MRKFFAEVFYALGEVLEFNLIMLIENVLEELLTKIFLNKGLCIGKKAKLPKFGHEDNESIGKC